VILRSPVTPPSDPPVKTIPVLPVVKPPSLPPEKWPTPASDRVTAAQQQLPQNILDESSGQLVQTAAGTDDQVKRFALLQMAQQKAIAAGDVNTAFSALDEMDQRYKVDVLRMKAEVLGNLGLIQNPSVAADTAKVALDLVNAAVSAKRYDVADTAVSAALKLARNGDDSDLVKQVTLRVLEIQKLRQ
jgi:hypothetical protein